MNKNDKYELEAIRRAMESLTDKEKYDLTMMFMDKMGEIMEHMKTILGDTRED